MPNDSSTTVIQICQALFAATPGSALLAEFTDFLDTGHDASTLIRILLSTPQFLGLQYSQELSDEAFANAFVIDIAAGKVNDQGQQWAVQAILDSLESGRSRDSIIAEVISAVSNSRFGGHAWQGATASYHENAIGKILENLTGETVSEALKNQVKIWMQTRLEVGENIADIAYSAMIALDLTDHSDPVWGAAADRFDNRSEISFYFSRKQSLDSEDLATLKMVLADVTNEAESVTSVVTRLNEPLSGTVQDGYLAGALVFVDSNADGIHNPGEVSVISDANGNFTLPAGVFGRIVAIGGTDISTNLPFTGSISAVAGSSTVSPLTTLARALVDKGFSPEQAENRLLQSLGLPTTVDLRTLDPIAVALGNGTEQEKSLAAKVQAATANIANVLQLGAATIQGLAPDKTSQQTMSAVTVALAEAIAGSSNPVNLSESSTLRAIITSASQESTDSSAAQRDKAIEVISGILADTNNRVNQALAENSGDIATALDGISNVQRVVQGELSQTLSSGVEESALDNLTEQFTGSALDAVIAESASGEETTQEPEPPVVPVAVFTITESPQGVWTISPDFGNVTVTEAGGSLLFTPQSGSAQSIPGASIDELVVPSITLSGAQAVLALIPAISGSVQANDALTVAQANSLNGVISGELSATISETCMAALVNLQGSANHYGISISDANVEADAVLALTSATTETIDATAVTSLQGTVATIQSTLDSSALSLAASLDAILTTGTADAQALLSLTAALNGGDIDGSGLTGLQGETTIVLQALAMLDPAPANIHVILQDTSADAAQLLTLASSIGSGSLDGNSIGSMTGSASDVLQALSALDSRAADININLTASAATDSDLLALAAAKGSGQLDGSALTAIHGAADTISSALAALDAGPVNFDSNLSAGSVAATTLVALEASNGTGAIDTSALTAITLGDGESHSLAATWLSGFSFAVTGFGDNGGEQLTIIGSAVADLIDLSGLQLDDNDIGVVIIEGNNGDDAITGTALGDNIVAGEGNDTINAGAGADDIDAGPGDDVIDAGSANDLVSAGEGNDQIAGGDGDDAINAGAGDDFIDSGAGDDQIEGGDGNDTLDHSSASLNQTVSISNGSGSSLGSGTDVLSGIENVHTGSGDDQFTISDAVDNSIDGNGGNDVVTVLAGSGTIYITRTGQNVAVSDDAGGIGNDLYYDVEQANVTGSGSDDHFVVSDAATNTLDGDGGNNSISYSSESAALTLSLTGSQIALSGGNIGNDTLLNFNSLETGSGDDSISFSGSVNFAVNSNEGADSFSFANGLSGSLALESAEHGELDFSALAAAVSIDLGLSTLQTVSTGLQLSFNGIFDTISTGNYDDSITSGSTDDTITTGDGNDYIASGAGNDVIAAGAGADTIVSAEGDDQIIAGAGNDDIDAGAGDDVIDSGAGDDIVDGGDGIDTLDHSTQTSSQIINISGDNGSSVGSGTDILLNIENFYTGSGDDQFTIDDAKDNHVDGNGGTDSVTVSGGSGTISITRSGLDVDVSDSGGGIGSDSYLDMEQVNVNGSNADDTFQIDDSANNSIDGGGGSNSADYSTSTQSFTVNLDGTQATVISAAAGTDNLSNFSRIKTGSGNDTFSLTGTLDHELDGNEGNTVFDFNSTVEGQLMLIADGIGELNFADFISAVSIDLSQSAAQTVASNLGLTLAGDFSKITGSAFDDSLVSSTTSDSLTGGSGDDIFVFTDAGSGQTDTVLDFSAGAATDDQIDLQGIAALMDFDDVLSAIDHDGTGMYTDIDLGNGNTLHLVGVDFSTLHSDDFLF
jgi:Ca2+-binding RTX toxin-like protein